MATLTPPKPRTAPRARTGSSAASSSPSRFSSVATDWLHHPLASMYLVAVPSALLLTLGTLMVWSASAVFSYTQFDDSYYFMKRQLAWVVIGVAVAYVTTRIPFDKLRTWGWAIFGVTGLMMCLTFVPGIGICKKGNCNWIGLGFLDMVRIQPSEVAKIALILWAATLFSAKRGELTDPKHLVLPFLPGAALILLLTLLQHDLGTAIVLGVIVIAMLWCVGASWRIVGGMIAAAAAAALALAFTDPNRLARILGFLSPTADASGTNYQPNQAQFGLASGGWWGVGLGASRQKWGSLSEAHTDYVLAIIGEELGLMGTLLVVVLLVVLGYAGFRIALRTKSFYARMVAAGITSWLMAQAMINVFVVLRMIPVLGVTLPLVSYGGSSLVVNLIAVGLLFACAKEEPAARDFLDRQARAKLPKGRLSAVLPSRRPAAPRS